MKLRKSIIGAFFLTVFVAACDTTKENTADSTDDRSGAPQKEMSQDETLNVEAMQKPETLAERRELRQQLGDDQANKLQDRASVQADQVEATVGEVPDDLLDKIIKDLLSKIEADRIDIEVLHAESLIWNDGSLGCGKPGQVYTHALVPGYRVILGHAGQQFDYRAAERGFFMLCEQPMMAAPGAGIDPPVQ